MYMTEGRLPGNDDRVEVGEFIRKDRTAAADKVTARQEALAAFHAKVLELEDRFEVRMFF